MTRADLNARVRRVEEAGPGTRERMFLHRFPRWDLQDEPHLIARVLEGDQEAFGILVRPYLHLFTIGIQRIVQDREDTQEALGKALPCLHLELCYLTDRNAFFTWAYRICIYEALLLRCSRSCLGETNVHAFLPRPAHHQGAGRPISSSALRTNPTT